MHYLMGEIFHPDDRLNTGVVEAMYAHSVNSGRNPIYFYEMTVDWMFSATSCAF